MRNSLLIAFSDLRILLRQRVAFIWLLVMPVAFIVFMGLANRGWDGPSNPNPQVLIDNLDTGFLATLLLEELNARGMWLVGEDERDKAKRGITIPAGFTETVLSGEQGEVDFFKVEGSADAAAMMIEVRLVRALVAINAALVKFARDNPVGTQPAEVDLRAILESPDPVILDARFAGRDPIPTGFNQSLPGILVMFLLINLLSFGAISLSTERKEGILKRLSAYPVRRTELVLGKILGRFLVGGVQAVVILVLGQLVFGVKVGHNLALIALTLTVYGWLCASLGVLIGAVTSNPDRVLGLSIVIGMMMAALGGCWWPLEIVGETMQAVGMSLPTGWAMSALHQLISFGGGWAQIDWQLGLLALLGVIVTLLSGRFLRYE